MNVQQFLKDRNVSFEVYPHRETYDAQHLAQAMHVPGREVAKTVLLRVDRGHSYAVAVLPATRMIDLDSIGRILGGAKIELATEVEMHESMPDCDTGALPPFGSMYGMQTMVERSLTEDEQIVFEANTHDEAIRMSYRDFQEVENPLVGEFSLQS